jgi:hypothetical protein
MLDDNGLDKVSDDVTTTESSSSTNAASSNVDLFAAGNIKAKTIPTPTRNMNVTTRTITEAQSAVQKGNMGAYSLMELQAELLRLEAERDQIIVDRQRIDDDKERLVDIDNFIILIINQLDKLVVDSEGGKEAATYPAAEKAILIDLVEKNRKIIGKDLFFRLAELANVAVNIDEKTKFLKLCDNVMEAIMETDASLHATVTTDIQKELDMELNKLKDAQKSKELEGAQLYDKMLLKKLLEEY